MQDELTDDELLTFMKQQYEEICFGDLEYLKSTCLERFVRAIRFRYQCRMQKRLRDEYSLDDNKANPIPSLIESGDFPYKVIK